MTLYEIILSGLLIIVFGVCDTVADAICYNGPEKALAEGAVNKMIQTLWRRVMPDKTNADLWMGMTHLPLDKQYSLRLLRSRICLQDIIHAIRSMDDYILQERIRATLPKDVDDATLASTYSISEFTQRSEAEVLRFFHAIEPMFLLLKIPCTDSDVIEAFHAYVISDEVHKPFK